MQTLRIYVVHRIWNLTRVHHREKGGEPKESSARTAACFPRAHCTLQLALFRSMQPIAQSRAAANILVAHHTATIEPWECGCLYPMRCSCVSPPTNHILLITTYQLCPSSSLVGRQPLSHNPNEDRVVKNETVSAFPPDCGGVRRPAERWCPGFPW